jgi:CRISPR/Cas system-associated exonuclease Cas4 (RecB family)
MLAIIAFAIVIILILTFRSWSSLKRKRQKSGVKGWVVSQDLDGKGKDYYVNKQIGLMCKPDVLEKNGVAEYKSSAAAAKPYAGDLVQLAAEMMATGAHVGVLKYKNGKTFTFNDTDPVMKQAIQRALNIMAQMRKSLATNIPPAGTPTANKCMACPVNRQCSYSIDKYRNVA